MQHYLLALNDMKLIVTHINHGSVIAQRIVQALIRDTTVRSAKASMSTGSAVRDILKTGVGNPAHPYDATLFLGREFSNSYRSMLYAFVPKDPRMATGSNLYDSAKTQAEIYFKAETILTDYAKDVIKREADGTLITKDATGKETQLDKVSADAVAKQITQLYADTDLLAIAAAAAGLKTDTEDPKNAFSFRHTMDEMSENMMSDFLERYTSSFNIVADASHGGNRNVIETVPLGHFNVVQMKGSVTEDDITLEMIGQFWKNTNSDRFSDIHRILMYTEVGLQVPGMKRLFEDLTRPGSSDRKSDSKPLNALLSEADRIKNIAAMKVFLSFQSWIALMQVMLKQYSSAYVIDKIKTYIPNYANVYDIDKIISDLMSLPIGKNTASLLGNYPCITSVQHNGEKKDVILASKDGLDAGGAIQQVIASLVEHVPYIDAIMTQKKWWDIYRHGASLCETGHLAFAEKGYDLDRVNTTFVQMGVTAGDPLQTADDWSFNMVFDWALNRFNSSARTLIRAQDYDTDSLVTPYHYGLVDYLKHLDDRGNALNAALNSGKIVGFNFAQLHYPMIPIQRAVHNVARVTLSIDQSLLPYGPASLMPIAPDKVNFITSTCNPVRIAKPVVGSYEVKMDRLPLEMLHYENIKKNTKGVNSAEESTIFEFLNVGKRSLSRLYAAGSQEPTSSLLTRFIRQDNKSGDLICGAITKDSLFFDMMNYTYFVPLKFTSDVIYEVAEVPVLDVTNLKFGMPMEDLARRRVGPVRVLESSPATALITVPGRLSGAQLVLGTGPSFLSSPDDIILNFSA